MTRCWGYVFTRTVNRKQLLSMRNWVCLASTILKWAFSPLIRNGTLRLNYRDSSNFQILSQRPYLGGGHIVIDGPLRRPDEERNQYADLLAEWLTTEAFLSQDCTERKMKGNRGPSWLMLKDLKDQMTPGYITDQWFVQVHQIYKLSYQTWLGQQTPFLSSKIT